MKGAALLVVAFRGRKVESFASRDVMRQKITRDRFLRRCAAVIGRNYVHDSGGIIDAHHKGLDTLQGHEQHQCCGASDCAGPPRSRHPSQQPGIAPHLLDAVGIPGFCLAEIRLEFRFFVHGELRSECNVPAGADAVGGVPSDADARAAWLIARKCASHLTPCLAHAASPMQNHNNVMRIRLSCSS